MVTYELRHPLLGELTVTRQSCAAAEAPGRARDQHGPPGSALAGALVLPAQAGARRRHSSTAHLFVRP